MKDKVSDEIVIVGAGPAGLVAAITLARAGVPTVVIERRTEPSTHPRATVVSTWAMELLRRWGLAERLRALEREQSAVHGPRVVRHESNRLGSPP